MPATRMYSQTIRMKDTEGAAATILLRPIAGETTEVLCWHDDRVLDAAIVATLIQAALALTKDVEVRELLHPAWATAFDRATHTGKARLTEGEVTPADDFPF